MSDRWRPCLRCVEPADCGSWEACEHGASAKAMIYTALMWARDIDRWYERPDMETLWRSWFFWGYAIDRGVVIC